MDQVVLNIQAEAATDKIRTETYQGREFMVVPVVALVEGVLHSANADHPELALATEFGRYPSAWDGRPVVMNHPQINEDYVSANSPQVLEDWSYGLLFNTQVDGKKLKTEAWIDLTKVSTSGGEIQTTVGRINGGELVEVSTGLFAFVEERRGTFEGDSYEGIWRSVAPDHLAFLSQGTIGACSVEDGCGVPRLNLLRRVKPSSSCCGGACHSNEEGGAAIADESNEERSETEDGDDTMSNNAIGDVTSEAPADDVTDNTETTTVEDGQTTTETVDNPAVNEAPATVEDYIAAAPAGMQEVLSESMRLHNERKGKIVEGLVANSRNEYTEDELNAMGIRNLEKLSKLANVPTYVGSTPSAPRTQASGDDGAPKPLEAFPVNKGKDANAA